MKPKSFESYLTLEYNSIKLDNSSKYTIYGKLYKTAKTSAKWFNYFTETVSVKILILKLQVSNSHEIKSIWNLTEFKTWSQSFRKFQSVYNLCQLVQNRETFGKIVQLVHWNYFCKNYNSEVVEIQFTWEQKHLKYNWI